MNGYFIRPSRVTPSIYFDPKKGIFDMRGKSNPENPNAFYDYVLKSLDAYAELDGDSTMTTNLAFEYYNTSSSKYLYMFMQKLAMIDGMGKKVTVNWFFEQGDEDMREAGEELEGFFDMRFNIKEVSKINAVKATQIAAA
ncbi:DUF1987 domain-containing protein [Reichenbachiella versicolor]|uniref:DUF1987 domain-containing protein n=1 Tax=Reichenbachiella versicolor TaxID=1821036 RepID=UPI000D6E7577|nr:DUF1987 domain-containing protein [Reichenbachiella versicolor]